MFLNLKKKRFSQFYFKLFVFFLFVEFPALLLNIETGLVDSVFHRYVRPTYFSKLSEYCQKSTGITQTFIDTQQQFADVFTDFIQWMGDIMMKYDLIFATPFNLNSPKWYNVTFCSWTDWDLGHFLYRDCIRNKIDRFDGLKAWIDIRRSYKDFAVSKMCVYSFVYFQKKIFLVLCCV